MDCANVTNAKPRSLGSYRPVIVTQNLCKMSSQKLSSRAEFTRNLLVEYEAIRGKKPDSGGSAFWDMVVISAGAESQKAWYEEQLADKLSRGELPLVEYRVFSDPGGIRTGDGGATLHVVSELHSELGDSLFERKVLLIHSGGYSKRMPSHSCTSKIFSALPIQSSRLYQMLDVKLANYRPFIELMAAAGGGMFVTASDDIEAVEIAEDDLEGVRETLLGSSGRDPLLVSLAHPSPLSVGSGHGVFLLPEQGKGRRTLDLWDNCVEVLQKPSQEEMRSTEGLVRVDSETGDEFVFTDSAYWINPALMRELVYFYSRTKPVAVESSIYADFMVCQGSKKTRRLDEGYGEGSAQGSFKKKVAALMNNIPLKIVSLPNSKFYHIGTMSEYLDALCGNAQLAAELSFGARAVESVIDPGSGGVVMCSIVQESVRVPASVVMEFCKIESKIVLGERTILSNCHIDSALEIPGNFMFHTVPVNVNAEHGKKKYVTVAFGIGDDLKATVSDPADLRLGNNALASRGASELYFSAESEMSLWTARMFKAVDSPSESFRLTLDVVNDGGPLREAPFYSMGEVLSAFDKKAFLHMRNELRAQIADSKM